MPKISYQEIVTPDVSESGLVLHEWVMEGDGKFTDLYHFLDGKFNAEFHYGDAINKWKQICQSKQI